MRLTFNSLQNLFVAFLSLVAVADNQAWGQAYKDIVGYTRLRNEVGIGLADGTGISVALAEANAGPGLYFPDLTNPEFTGKTFTDASGSSTVGPNGHTTEVASRFFGNSSSFAPGVKIIQVYDAADFVFVKQGLNLNTTPTVVTTQSVMNHSYRGDFSSATSAQQSNARLDFTIARDNFTSVVALGNLSDTQNVTGRLPSLYGQSYNSIVVGRSDGNHSSGATDVGVLGRVKPDIVAPETSTSNATPLVSSAAAMLHQAANSFGPNARNSVAMKSIIMAGATKDSIPTWSNTSTRPLDSTYGAGQLNVYSSYRILEAGETNGVTSVTLPNPAVNSGLQGWDYGASITPGSPLLWNFNVAEGQSISEASILLTWNAQYKDVNGFFNSTLSLANMDLKLFRLGAEIAASSSLIDNVEHIYLKNLSSGLYTISVSSDLDTSFGLAWNITAVPEPSSIACLCVVSLFGYTRVYRLRRTKKNLLTC